MVSKIWNLKICCHRLILLPDLTNEPNMKCDNTQPKIKVGTGLDVHRLVIGRPLVLGGVPIVHDKGLQGHSDADVLLHAICDAILGAAGLGDIGRHFPDTDARYKNANSMDLLKQCADLLHQEGYGVSNIDATLILERPKVGSYVRQMEENIANVLNIDPKVVNVKATTTETLGFTGRKEGIAAQSVVLAISHRESD